MPGVILPFFISHDVRIEPVLSALLIEMIIVLSKCSLLASSSHPQNCFLYLVTATFHEKVAHKFTCFILAEYR